MKRLYILIPLLLLFISATSYGQKIRFTDSTNEWTYYTFDQSGSNTLKIIKTYRYDSSIIFNNKKYLRLTYQSPKVKPNQGFYIREDTLLNKVYYLKDTFDAVLFDFSLNLGDTFFTGDGCNPTVGLLNTSFINGVGYKVFDMGTEVFEGIGSYDEFFITRCAHPDKWTKLICFKNKGNIIDVQHYSGIGYVLSKSTCALDVNNITTNNRTISISPNPANHYSKIIFPYTIQSGRLSITDVLGKTICSKSITNKTEIAIGEMPASGVYFYMLTDSSGNKFAGRFVYQ